MLRARIIIKLLSENLKIVPLLSPVRLATLLVVSEYYSTAERPRKTSLLRTLESMKVCDIEDDVKDALRQFRFRKHNNNAALILKVDREKQKICIDSMVEDTCLDDLREILPGHQPRYVVYSNRMEHSDGRVSYPLSFIYITPQDSQRDLQVMYAGTKLALQKEADLTRVYEVRELDELTDEWLKEKLSK